MQILPYSEANLALVLSNKHTSPETVQRKRHFQYFAGYLGSNGIGAKTIVVEENYISKDYLHDYASYYALCFKPYNKYCSRVHFFSAVFDKTDFEKIIAGKRKDNDGFWDQYLGFIVVKPIPKRIIGYTVLKTYEAGEEFEQRNFWGIREYKIHVYGNEVKIHSLAFQEQDQVLAACATTAIWSMLNKAAADFHTVLKSPSQITRDADKVSTDGSRLFPNKGLNILQVCQAILNSGMVSEVKQPDTSDNDFEGNPVRCISNVQLKKILNAYSPIGIPLILVIQVPHPSGHYEKHAITVSGYKQQAPKSVIAEPDKKISWLAENIEKFYAHDDQWGPFSRIGFKNTKQLDILWTDHDKTKRPVWVNNIIVPLYPKIRISYLDIEAAVIGLDRILSYKFFDDNTISDLVWDIKIDYSENFKTQVKNSTLSENLRLKTVSSSMPKYIWVATCYVGTVKVIEVTFDATDVNGMIALDVLWHSDEETKKAWVQHLETNADVLKHILENRAIDYDSLLNKVK